MGEWISDSYKILICLWAMAWFDFIICSREFYYRWCGISKYVIIPGECPGSIGHHKHVSRRNIKPLGTYWWFIIWHFSLRVRILYLFCSKYWKCSFTNNLLAQLVCVLCNLEMYNFGIDKYVVAIVPVRLVFMYSYVLSVHYFNCVVHVDKYRRRQIVVGDVNCKVHVTEFNFYCLSFVFDDWLHITLHFKCKHKILTCLDNVHGLFRGPAVPLFSCISCIFLYSDLPPVFSCIFIKNAANSCFFLYFWKWLEQVPRSFFFAPSLL